MQLQPFILHQTNVLLVTITINIIRPHYYTDAAIVTDGVCQEREPAKMAETIENFPDAILVLDSGGCIRWKCTLSQPGK